LGQKAQLAWLIGGVARYVKMFNGKSKIRYLDILDDIMEKEKFY
jgi:hypothetical protein